MTVFYYRKYIYYILFFGMLFCVNPFHAIAQSLKAYPNFFLVPVSISDNGTAGAGIGYKSHLSERAKIHSSLSWMHKKEKRKFEEEAQNFIGLSNSISDEFFISKKAPFKNSFGVFVNCNFGWIKYDSVIAQGDGTGFDITSGARIGLFLFSLKKIRLEILSDIGYRFHTIEKIKINSTLPLFGPESRRPTSLNRGLYSQIFLAIGILSNNKS